MYLLDTNICIYAMNGRYPELNRKLLSVHPDDILISAITVGELEYGAAKSKWGESTRQKLCCVLANYTVIPFVQSDAVLFGRLRARLAAAGTPIGAYDLMIAAQGVSRDLTVVTHNTGEFSRVPGIVLEDWAMK